MGITYLFRPISLCVGSSIQKLNPRHVMDATKSLVSLVQCSVLIILGLTNWNWSPNAGIDLHSLSLTRMEIFPTIIRQATYYITYSREAPISGRECWWPCRQRLGRGWGCGRALVSTSIIHWPQLAASWSLYICLHRHPTLLFSVILPPADAVMALLVETMRGMYTIIDTAYNSRQPSEFGGRWWCSTV